MLTANVSLNERTSYGQTPTQNLKNAPLCDQIEIIHLWPFCGTDLSLYWLFFLPEQKFGIHVYQFDGQRY